MSHAIWFQHGSDALAPDQLSALCDDPCYSSLEDARKKIHQACTSSNDQIVNDNVAYPGRHPRTSGSVEVAKPIAATYLVDNFIYTYNMSCRRDA